MVTKGELDTCISVIQELFPDYYKIMRADLTKEQIKWVTKELDSESNEKFWDEKIKKFTVNLDDLSICDGTIEFSYTLNDLYFNIVIEIDCEVGENEPDCYHYITVSQNHDWVQNSLVWDDTMDSQEMIRYLDNPDKFFNDLNENIYAWANEELNANADGIEYFDCLKQIVK